MYVSTQWFKYREGVLFHREKSPKIRWEMVFFGGEKIRKMKKTLKIGK